MLEKGGLTFAVASDTCEGLCTYPVVMRLLRIPPPCQSKTTAHEHLGFFQGAFLLLPLFLSKCFETSTRPWVLCFAVLSLFLGLRLKSRSLLSLEHTRMLDQALRYWAILWRKQWHNKALQIILLCNY